MWTTAAIIVSEKKHVLNMEHPQHPTSSTSNISPWSVSPRALLESGKADVCIWPEAGDSRRESRVQFQGTLTRLNGRIPNTVCSMIFERYLSIWHVYWKISYHNHLKGLDVLGCTECLQYWTCFVQTWLIILKDCLFNGHFFGNDSLEVPTISYHTYGLCLPMKWNIRISPQSMIL